MDTLIIGSGFAGSVVARVLAEKGEKVKIIEKRNHIGGNCYDEYDEYGILVHKYMMNMVYWFISMVPIFFIRIIRKFLTFYHVLQNGMIIVMK